MQLKNQRSGSETVCGFLVILILKETTFLSQRVRVFCWTKNVNFNKNEMELKIESLHMLQLIQELQIKSKSAMSSISRKKKEGIFCTVYFVRRKFFEHFCFISIYSVLNNFSEHLYFNISKKPSYTSSLVFKIVGNL